MAAVSGGVKYLIEMPEESRQLNPEAVDYFEVQRERLLIQQAYETGYIQDATRDFVTEYSGRNPDFIVALSMNFLHLRNIGENLTLPRTTEFASVLRSWKVSN